MSIKGWPLRPLGRCAKFLSGGTPSKARAEFWEGDIPWVSSGELSSIAILRPNDQLLPYVLRFSLSDPSTKARLANRVSGVAIPRIIVKDFANFEITVPPRRLQCQWWEVIEATVNLIHVLLKQTEKLRAARDLLLPRLMSGEVAV